MITKAVIACGGLGTRFLPITKAVPKELLPIIDVPVVGRIVSEAAESGITDVLLILSPQKNAIKEFFSGEGAFFDRLIEMGKKAEAERLRAAYNSVKISFITQELPRGSADAVYLARSFCDNQAFCLAWGDDYVVAKRPVMQQLKEAFAGRTVVGVQHFEGDEIVKYGVAEVDKSAATGGGRLRRCGGIVEKPPLSALPSRYAALGRYILTDEIFAEIEGLKAVGGELRLTDAINSLARRGGVDIYEFEGQRFDMGDKLGSVKAVIDEGLKREFSDELKEYLRGVVAKF